MSNYRTISVRLVNKCQKMHSNHPGPYLKVMKTYFTSVHVANSTGTGLNNQPPGRMHVPEEIWRYLLLRIRRGREWYTLPLRPRTRVPVICYQFRSQPPQFLNQSVRALDHGPGIPHLFSLKKELFTGHVREFLPDIPESDVPLSLQGHQNRTGERPSPSVSFCTEIPCGEVNPDSKKNPECGFRNAISTESMQTVHHQISHREWSGAAIDQ